MAAGKMTGLAHIGVFTADMEESLRFYVDTLGFVLDMQKDLETPDGKLRLAFVQVGSCIVELIQPANTEQVKRRTNGIVDHICIAVENIDDLVQQLKAKGVSFDAEQAGSVNLKNGAKNIFFQGPNGERLEFFEFL